MYRKGHTAEIKEKPERKTNPKCDPTEAEGIEFSREGLWPTGLTAPERSREARGGTVPRTWQQHTGEPMKAVPVERGRWQPGWNGPRGNNR